MRKSIIFLTITLLCLTATATLVNTVNVTVDAQTPPPWDGGFIANPPHILLDASFNPTMGPNGGFIGGVPFCHSGSLGTVLCYTPSFLKKAYDFPSGLTGAGQTIVIVDAYGSPTVQSDVNLYDTVMGLPPVTINKLCPPTWTNSPSDKCPSNDLANATQLGWAEEITLDVTMAHGLAPKATIYLVLAKTDLDKDITAAEAAVVSQSRFMGSIMSQSFGEPDDLVGCVNFPTCTIFDTSIRAAQDAVYATAMNNHWTVLASSGDSGANTAYTVRGTSELTPSWPATNPLVLAVGGTEGLPYGGQYGPPPGPGGVFKCAAGATCNTGLLIIAGNTNGCQTATRPGIPTGCTPRSYGGEQAWNEFNSFGVRTATGGGVSSFYARPSYQSALPSTFTTVPVGTIAATGRSTPDVAFNSAIHGGWLAYLGFLGVWGVFGGTSAASPAWAAIIALLNQAKGSPVGFANPAIYILAEGADYSSAFHDITKGSNPIILPPNHLFQGFPAGPGYDLTTGWGTPDVANFIADFP